MSNNDNKSAEQQLKELQEMEKRKDDLLARAEDQLAKAANQITLNVGGTEFRTSRITLLSQKGTFFETMLSGGNWKPDPQGQYFIDRDPTLFPYVLNYLRMGKFIKRGDVDVKDIQAEFEYYQVAAPEVSNLPPSTPSSSAPATSSPATTASTTSNPVPSTPTPSTPAPSTPSPTPAPSTPAPSTPAPSTPASSTPSPTPALSTPPPPSGSPSINIASSKLLNTTQAGAIYGWVGTGNIMRLYAGSIDGFTSSAFHAKCDHKGPTVVLVQSTSGYLFGGYASESWSSIESGCLAAEGCFLFTLTNPKSLPPTKFPLTNPKYALYNHSIKLACFGLNDLEIVDECNKKAENSTDNSMYDIPKHALTGTAKFTVKEIEVYSVKK